MPKSIDLVEYLKGCFTRHQIWWSGDTNHYHWLCIPRTGSLTRKRKNAPPLVCPALAPAPDLAGSLHVVQQQSAGARHHEHTVVEESRDLVAGRVPPDAPPWRRQVDAEKASTAHMVNFPSMSNA
jgi:hypothetical protein